MNGILFSSTSLIALAFQDAGLMLFGAVLVLFGGALGMSVSLQPHPRIVRPLLAVFAILFLLLVAITTLDLTGASGIYYTFSQMRELSELLSTHRWLLIELPILLLLTSMGILIAYREHIAESHAKSYRHIVQFSTAVSFVSILFIAFESML